MEFNHISECWEKVREARTDLELEALFKQFPRWSGEWYLEVDFDGADKKFIVYNDYWNDNLEALETDYEEVDIIEEKDVD